MPKSRNIRLTPIQRDIVWTLEEAGGESLSTLLATLGPGYPGFSTNEFLVEMADDMLRLYHLGYVELYRESQGPVAPQVVLTVEEVRHFWLTDVMRWNDSAGTWVWDERRGGPHEVHVLLTDMGYQAL